jgi:hypothetical protein
VIHYQQIERQAEDWRALRKLHPGAPLVVAGDFNQDRDGSGWYGTHRGRDLLTQALDDVNLTCVTAEDVVAIGKLRASHLIGHLALCTRWNISPDIRLTCWEQTDPDGTHLSDRPTVAIDLHIKPSRRGSSARPDRLLSLRTVIGGGRSRAAI